MKEFLLHINGIETPVTVADDQVLSPVEISGDKSDFRIDYGNGLTKVGGVVRVSATPVTDGVIEGVHNIVTPFTKLLNYTAVAMNVQEAAASVNGENVFVADTDTGFKIYATAKAATAKTIQVRWSAEGIMEDSL